MPEAKKTNTLFEKAILFQKEELNITYPDYIEYPIFKFYLGKKIEYCHPSRPPQILIEKVLKNWFFQLLASLGFGECFFLFKSWLKKYWKIDFFPAFGKILVLGNVFFLFKF